MAKNLSNSFAGSWSRKSEDAIAEVERRATKNEIYTKLDVFTDEFSPPYTGELGPGQNPNKSSQPFEDKQALFAENTLPSAFNKKVQKSMAAAGNARDQAMLDEIDEVENKFNVKPVTINKPVPGDDKFWRNERGLAKEIERRIKLKEKSK